MQSPGSSRALAALSLTAGLLAATAAEAQQTSVLRYVPQADLRVLDPVTNNSPVVTQFGYMVYDQLFAVDGDYKPHPQMVDNYTASPDAKSYRFTLRDGLKFHDGAPVRSGDAIGSITRWAKKDPAGQKMMAAGMKLAAVDDRTFTMTFEKPFGPAITIMAKPSWPLFVFPERNTVREPTDANNDAIGSGPYRFVRAEWTPGSKVVYEKNPDYVPRGEPANGYAGGKIAHINRVEWVMIPDANTAVSALRRGEVDIVESIPIDLAKSLKGDANVVVAVFNKVGLQMYLRPNHLQPPFDNPKGRQALMHMVNQEDYMRSVIGDPDYWKLCWAYLMCGSPMGSEAGTEAYRKPDRAKARQLLQEAGYKGEKIVVLGSTGIFAIPEETQVLVQELRAIGVNVDEQQMDFNTMLSRRSNTGPASEGGWHIIPLWSFGPDLANPLTSQMLTAPCTKTGWPGWACDPKLEQLREDWAAAPTEAAQKAVAEQIQLQAVNLIGTIPLGQFYQPVAYRKALSGMLTAPYPIAWNLKK
jgi:peptide/nickel transport system substrate-binding protein